MTAARQPAPGRAFRRIDERGLALAVTIFALIILGALLATGFRAGHLEQRAGRNGVYAGQAADAAEAGAAEVIGNWGTYPQLAALAVGDSVTLPGASLDRRTTYQPTVFRPTESLYLVRSRGIRADADGNVLAQRLVGTLARTLPAGVVPLRQRSWVRLSP